MKKRSERLDVVQQVASRTEREHAERVAAAERHLSEMKEKLEALRKYRGEYETNFATRAGAGFSVTAVRDFQTFLARLGEALKQQGELVAAAEAAVETVRGQWREAAQRAHVVDAVAERWKTEESRAESRRDQKESDELSQQRTRNRESNT